MAAIKRRFWLEFVVLILAAALGLVAAPSSLSRDSSPADLVENALPAKVTMKNASKSDLLDAVCAAVRKNRKSAAGITSVAVTAHGEFAGEVVGTVLRCTRKTDCTYVGAVVAAAVKAQPASGTAISDAAMARAPNCSETIEAAVKAAAQSQAGPAAAAGAASPTGTRTGSEENFDPHEQLVLVCADNVERAIRQSLLGEFMHAHTGSFLGPCPPPTPALSPTPSPVPNPAPVQVPPP